MTYIRKNIGDILAFCLALVISVWIFGWYIKEYQGILVFAVSLVAAFVAGFLLAWLKENVKKETFFQLAAVCVVPFLIVTTAVLKPEVYIDNESKRFVTVYMIFFTTLFVLLLYAVQWLMNFSVSGLKSFIGEHKIMLLIMVGIILIRLPYVYQLPRWDSGEYYYRFSTSVDEFTFSSFSEFMDSFALCGHPTLGFCAVYLTGEMLFPFQIIGESVTSLILTVIALWCVYKILLRVCTGISNVKAAVFTLIFSMAPLFYSTSMYFNPDYAMALFFMIVMYAYVYNMPFLAGVFSLMCFQTKETGLVLVGGLVIGVFVKSFLENRKDFKGFLMQLIKDLRLWWTLLATIIQFFYNKSVGGISDWSREGRESGVLSWNSSGEDCFGFNPEYVLTRLKQQFIINFNWIVAATILICIIVLIVNRKKIHQKKTHEVCMFVGSFAALLAFSCLYITAAVYRYNVSGDLLLYLIMLYFLYRVDSELLRGEGFEKKAVYVYSAVLFVCIGIQCFFTIDPLTRLAFQTRSAGNTTICYVGRNKDINSMYYGDYMVYNTQYTYLDRAQTQILANVGYDPYTMDIIQPDINDSFIAGNVPLYYLNWDAKKKKRVFYQNEDTTQMEGPYVASIVARGAVRLKGLKSTAIYISSPYWLHVDEQKELQELSVLYDIGEKQTLKTFQGSIDYYVLTLKEK
jgi:hypothetical protein